MRVRRPILASLTAAALALPLAGIGAAQAAPTAPEPPPPGAQGVPVPQELPKAPEPEGDDAAGGADSKVAANLASASGQVTAFVQLDAASAVETAEAGGSDAEVAAVEQEVAALAEEVVPAAAAPEALEVTSNLVAGVVVAGDAAQIRELAERPDVVRVHLIVPKKPANKGADVFTRALESWQSTGLTGQDVTIGVIDTGVDYTHANFGGPGTLEAYAEAYGTDGTGPVPDGLFDPAKYLGGWDFAGPTYDADTDTTPDPDANPIDAIHTGGGGHGSHVAGSAAGYGTNADGTTFGGDYTTLTDLSDMRIGPGTAPEAGIYALKVFGDVGGSTGLVISALEWAADPNGDGDLNDHLDIVNLSLGSDYSAADDPENLFIDELSRLGVLSVIASGNAGDATDIGGSPGNSRTSLTVANSVADTQTYDAIEVVEAADPALVGLHAAQNTVNYGGPDVTAPVAYVGEFDGCTAFTAEQAAAVAGKIAWLWWDDDDATRVCGSTVRWNNATAAGAVGVLIGTELPVFSAGISGNAAIPGAQLTAAVTDAVMPEVQAGTLVAHIGPSLANAALVTDPDSADTLAAGSSRGVHGSLGIVKPDVAAPGTRIASTASGTGDDVLTISGTSMATPHVAGIAALVVQQHAGWEPEEVKAAVMNTATHDVYSELGQGGPAFGPERVGSGRVDALDAVTTDVIAYATQDPELVSVTFGIVDVGAETVVQQRQVTVRNTGDEPRTFATSFSGSTTAGSATITTTPASITVAPGDEALVTLTLTVDPEGLTRDIDPTSDPAVFDVLPREFVTTIAGRLVLTPAYGSELRVPVQAAPRPVSDLSAQPVAFADEAATTAPLVLEGRGVTTEGWASHVAPLTLVATSPQLEEDPSGQATSESSVAAGDIRYVGFSSTAPQIAAAGGDPRAGTIGIGIATEGQWANLGSLTTIPYVRTDVDSDGVWDYETAVLKYVPEIDLTVATTYELVPDGAGGYDAGDIVGEIPVNGVWADQFTTVFDNDVLVVPIPLAGEEVLIAPGQVPTFSVATASAYATDASGDIDSVEPFTADPYAPPFWFEGTTPDSLWFESGDGATITVHRAPTTGDAQLLLLHNANADGSRAEVVEVTAPVATPTTTTLSVDRSVLRDGAPIRLDAHVAPAEATGTVTFLDGTTELGTATVRNGHAWKAVPLAAGTHALQAVFTPDSPRWTGSSSEVVTVEVRARLTSHLVMQAPAQVRAGQSAWAVGMVWTDGARPFGTVEVSENGEVIAEADVVTLGRVGLVAIQLPDDLAVGRHHLTYTYTGNPWVAPSSVERDLRVVARR